MAKYPFLFIHSKSNVMEWKWYTTKYNQKNCSLKWKFMLLLLLFFSRTRFPLNSPKSLSGWDAKCEIDPCRVYFLRCFHLKSLKSATLTESYSLRWEDWNLSKYYELNNGYTMLLCNSTMWWVEKISNLVLMPVTFFPVSFAAKQSST